MSYYPRGKSLVLQNESLEGELEVGFLAEVCWQSVQGTLCCDENLHLGIVTDVGE